MKKFSILFSSYIQEFFNTNLLPTKKKYDKTEYSTYYQLVYVNIFQTSHFVFSWFFKQFSRLLFARENKKIKLGGEPRLTIISKVIK